MNIVQRTQTGNQINVRFVVVSFHEVLVCMNTFVINTKSTNLINKKLVEERSFDTECDLGLNISESDKKCEIYVERIF